MINKLFPAIALCFMLGCASIAPGNDPLIVNAERVERGASATFDVVVQLDHQNRAFYAQHAKEFHQFATWLREPVWWKGTSLPRGSALIITLNDAKTEYKRSKSESNTLISLTYGLDAILKNANTVLTKLPENLP